MRTQWIDEGVGNKPFHGGKSPNLMDLEIFGVLRALEGMRYMFIDDAQ
jgi:hypothetical protein